MMCNYRSGNLVAKGQGLIGAVYRHSLEAIEECQLQQFEAR